MLYYGGYLWKPIVYLVPIFLKFHTLIEICNIYEIYSIFVEF